MSTVELPKTRFGSEFQPFLIWARDGSCWLMARRRFPSTEYSTLWTCDRRLLSGRNGNLFTPQPQPLDPQPTWRPDLGQRIEQDPGDLLGHLHIRHRMLGDLRNGEIGGALR